METGMSKEILKDLEAIKDKWESVEGGYDFPPEAFLEDINFLIDKYAHGIKGGSIKPLGGI
jgi:hypothetical protein